MARVLIASIYYLDSHPAPPVLRVRAIERYLRERGHDVRVFHSHEAPSHSPRRNSLLRWVGWPDSHFPFVLKNAGKYRRIVRRFQPDVIYITAPPFSTLLLLPLSNRPALVEFRDVWSYDGILKLYRTPIQRWLTEKYEAFVLRRALRVITLNENQRDYLIKKHNLPPTRFATLPHFYTPLDSPKCTATPSGYVRICYMGTVDWMKGLERVIPIMERFPLISPMIRGRLKDVKIKGAQVLPPLPHREATEWACRNCDVMWVSLNRFEGHHLITSSKSISLLALKKPILATIPMDNPMAGYFREIGGIYTADIDDERKIEIALKSITEDHRRGKLKKPENPEIFRYDRVLKGLEELLEEI